MPFMIDMCVARIGMLYVISLRSYRRLPFTVCNSFVTLLLLLLRSSQKIVQSTIVNPVLSQLVFSRNVPSKSTFVSCINFFYFHPRSRFTELSISKLDLRYISWELLLLWAVCHSYRTTVVHLTRIQYINIKS